MSHPDPLRQDVALDALNTLRLPARAAWFAAIDNVDTLRAVLDDPRVAGLPRLVLGGGSNLVLTGDFPGLVLQVAFHGRSRVQEDAAIHQVLGASIDSADDMSMPGHTRMPASILRTSALSATIQCGNGEAHCGIRQFIGPVSGIPGVAVEHKRRRVRTPCMTWAHQACVNPRLAHAREIQVETFRIGRLKFGGNKLDIRLNHPHFFQRGIPIGVEIFRARIGSLVGNQFFERQVKGQWHEAIL